MTKLKKKNYLIYLWEIFKMKMLEWDYQKKHRLINKLQNNALSFAFPASNIKELQVFMAVK